MQGKTKLLVRWQVDNAAEDPWAGESNIVEGAVQQNTNNNRDQND